MLHSSYEDMSRLYMLTRTPPSSSPREETIPQNPSPISSLSEALRDTPSANPRQPTLACPVSVCSLVFKGEMGRGYLWRHLRRPGVYRRTGDEKDAWLNLHKIEYDKLVATRVTPAQRRREASRARSQMLRTSEFEQRARGMGITEKELIAQKVKIWEGMRAAKQIGDSVGHSAWVLLDFCTGTAGLPRVHITLPAHG